jgi:hypothetical protein
MTSNQEEIEPEDYNINDLWKYSAELKDQIIRFLDSEVHRLKEDNDNMNLLLMKARLDDERH